MLTTTYRNTANAVKIVKCDIVYPKIWTISLVWAISAFSGLFLLVFCCFCYSILFVLLVIFVDYLIGINVRVLAAIFVHQICSNVSTNGIDCRPETFMPVMYIVPSQKFLKIFFHKFLSNLVHRQTDKPRQRRTISPGGRNKRSCLLFNFPDIFRQRSWRSWPHGELSRAHK